MIKAKNVIVHFECCECKDKTEERLIDLGSIHGMLCDECDNMENYLIVKGITVKGVK